MNPGKFNMGQSRQGDGAQFAPLFTEEAIDLAASTPTVLSTVADLYISIVPTTGSARIHITEDGVPTSVGKLIEGEYSTIVRKGLYLSADAIINVTPHGDIQ